MPSFLRLFAALSLLLPLAAATHEVQLRSPLTTLVRLAGEPPAGAFILRAVIQVPDQAPADLGVGAFVADRHGRWFQRLHPGVLHPGANVVALSMAPGEPLVAEPQGGMWRPDLATQANQAGLFFWSSSSTPVTIGVDDLVAEVQAVAEVAPRLGDLELPSMRAGAIRLATAARYEFSLLPQPFPANPYDPGEFSLDAVFTHADGRVMRVAGFACEAMTLHDRGDREIAEPEAAARFLVRWRPPLPGRWQAHLEARWQAGEPLVVELPPIVVEGAACDDVVRVDAADPRFFSRAGEWFWPIGMNLHSTFDVRSRDRLGTALTPERGTLAYADRFRRLAAAGGNATEIWMASWNLALEWNATWPGYAGIGRYNQANAAKLDAVLDAAQANGIRVNLVLNNHGQASPNADREWKDNPWNRDNGGPLTEPYQLFKDPRSLTGQAHLRRYLMARYGDHPAILGWKLWSEINLTAVGDSQRRGLRESDGLSTMVSASDRLATLVGWHEAAAAHLHAIDPYGHPVTTHWSGDYRKPNPEVCALPGLNYLCIDAYHGGRSDYSGSTLIDLIWNGMEDSRRGLAQFKKPLLVTEFGGGSGGTSTVLLAAELASAPWAAAMSGNAGMPFMWWFEWIDQNDQWQPFGAIARFLKGEDLRGSDARAVVLSASGDHGPWWVRAWVRPGRMLGYVANHQWSGEGGDLEPHRGILVRIGSQVAPGPCRIEWWDANRGVLVGVQEMVHPGGVLELTAPVFLHHIAFKLVRATALRPVVR